MKDISLSEKFASPLSPHGVEELKEKKEMAGRLGRGDRNVCVCGHSVGYHQAIERGLGVTASTCVPGRNSCMCMEVRPVVRVSNLRRFLHKTDGRGYGNDHALGAGLVSAFAAGDKIEWLEGTPSCDKCRAQCSVDSFGHLLVFPVALSPISMLPIGESSGTDRIICIDCLDELVS